MNMDWPQLKKLNWFGLWPTDRGMMGQLQKYWSHTVLLWAVVLFGAELVSSWYSSITGDLIGTLININEFISGVQCYMATIVFVISRKSLEESMKQLDGWFTFDLTREVSLTIGNLATKEFDYRKKKGKYAYYIFFCSFIFICNWAARPLMNMAIYGHSSSIVHSWVPCDNGHLLGFLGNFLFQIIPCLSFCLGFILFGSIYVSFSELFLGHFVVLSRNLELMDYGKKPNNRLSYCVKHHAILLKICTMFRDITSIPLITQCLFTMLALCMSMFELSISDMNKSSSGRVINVSAETLQELLLLVTYCWYGNSISIQSLELLRSGYMSNWYEGTATEKKILLNIMTRSSLPIYMGGFIKMNFLTFINVIKAAFSYYSFLVVLATITAAK